MPAAVTVTAMPAQSQPVLTATLAVPSTPTPPQPTAVVLTPTTRPPVATCELKPVIRPTLPAKIPLLYQLDESTGLHMTGDYIEVDLAEYRLKVTGLVKRPLTLTLDEIRCMPKITAKPTLTCATAMDHFAYFTDKANWSGASLKYILELAGIEDTAKSAILKSADGYLSIFPLEEALKEDSFLAYEWEGQPLPVLHGFPIRAVLPSQLGNKWVKWLVEIRVGLQ